MNMMILLLVSAVMLLLSPAAGKSITPRPEENLNQIIDLASKYKQALVKQYFVEDVSHLAEECEDKFFCKVYTILHEHEHFKNGEDEEKIVRNLSVFVNQTRPSCSELLQNVTSTGVLKPIPHLVNYLISCIRSRNFKN